MSVDAPVQNVAFPSLPSPAGSSLIEETRFRNKALSSILAENRYTDLPFSFYKSIILRSFAIFSLEIRSDSFPLT